MTGRPQRDLPKETIRLVISKRTWFSLRPLLKSDAVEFSSMSQLVETIVFLSEHIYAVEPDNGFVLSLARLHADQVIAQIKDPSLYDSRYMHVSMDVHAIEFVDMLVERYPMLFRRRSDVMELLLWSVGRECDDPNGVRYYANRLAEVQSLHPTRADERSM